MPNNEIEVTPESVLRSFLERYGHTPVMCYVCDTAKEAFVIQYDGGAEVWILHQDQLPPERRARRWRFWLAILPWWASYGRCELMYLPESLLQFMAGIRYVQRADRPR